MSRMTKDFRWWRLGMWLNHAFWSLVVLVVLVCSPCLSQRFIYLTYSILASHSANIVIDPVSNPQMLRVQIHGPEPRPAAREAQLLCRQIDVPRIASGSRRITFDQSWTSYHSIRERHFSHKEACILWSRR